MKKDSAESPIRMRLVCEKCGTLHVDEGEFATKPHHTHQCERCGLVWRPAVENTVGVVRLWEQSAPEPPSAGVDAVGETLRQFARLVRVRTKHGPGGSGDSGPCDEDCVKCRAETLSGRGVES